MHHTDLLQFLFQRVLNKIISDDKPHEFLTQAQHFRMVMHLNH